MNTEHEEILIGQVASNDAGDDAWSDFERHAKENTGAWERLARTLRNEAQMRCALDEALESSENVEVTREMLASGRRGRPRIMQPWSGWAIAAVLAIAWIGTTAVAPILTDEGAGQNQTHEVIRANRTDEAYREYLDLGRREGRIVEELPKIMVESRTLDENGYVEVYYIRPLLERVRVDSAYQIQRDDLGRQTLGPINLASYERKDF